MWKKDVVKGCSRNHSQYAMEVLVASHAALTCQQCAAEAGGKEKGDFCSIFSRGEAARIPASMKARAASSHPAPLSENAELDTRENTWISQINIRRNTTLTKKPKKPHRIQFNTSFSSTHTHTHTKNHHRVKKLIKRKELSFLCNI